MGISLDDRCLYLPKVGARSMQGMAFGLLLLTDRAIFFVPEHPRAGTAFWSVVPDLAARAASLDELHRAMEGLAKSVPGSHVLRWEQVQGVRFGFLGGFAVEAGGRSLTFTVGLFGKLAELRAFLERTRPSGREAA